MAYGLSSINIKERDVSMQFKHATPPYIIAEIGFNHDGQIDVAIEMIQAAAKAGASAVKFQTYRAGDIALPSSPHYQNIKSGELSYEQHIKLFEMTKHFGIDFISTPFSPWAVELLEKLDVPAYKVASMDCTNNYLLGYIAQTKKPIYISTGMASLEEIATTLNFLKSKSSGPISLLHCISKYPAYASDLNLQIIQLLKILFGLRIGYSDHCPGTKACLAAVILGAEIIETHFTLDSSKEGGDHYHSVEPKDLQALVADINLFQEMRGTANGIFERPDRHLASTFRRGLHTARKLSKGDIIGEADLLMCRPTSILSPNEIESVLGRSISLDLPPGTPMNPKYIKKNDVR
jgi:sialic acid synthase SpsE